MNTPIKIILDPADETQTGGTGTPTNPKLPKGYEDLPSVPVLPANPTLEQLKAGLKTKKTDCAALLADYQCGQNDIPSVPSGDIIQPNVGDEIAINSIGFEVVELDGSGNGRGIVKVPMFQNAKFGVEFKGIKVAKGGCVVAGQAELSNVDVALLNEEQRKKLAGTYEAFNKVLDVVDANAEGVAETFNSVWALMDGIKDRAAKIAAKLSGGQNASAKEIKDLAKLTENSAAMLQKSLNDIKKQAQTNANAGKVDEMQKIIDQQKASAKALMASAKDIKTDKDNKPTPQDPVGTANTKQQVDALALTNGADVKKKLEGLKGVNLAIEFDGKVYTKNNTKIKIPLKNGSVVQGDDAKKLPLNCAFHLKGFEAGSPITWQLTDGNNSPLPLDPPLRISAKADDEYLGIYYPAEQKTLKLTATSGGKSLTLILEKPNYFVKDLVAIDVEHPSRIASANKDETLYLVQNAVSGKFKSRIVDYKYNSNAEDSYLKQFVTTYNFTANTNQKFNPQVGPYEHIIPITYDKVPNRNGLGINAFDYNKVAKVELVDENRDRVDYADKLSKLLVSFEKLTSVYKDLKNYLPCELDYMTSLQLSDLIKRKQFAYALETYNEEKPKSRLYNEVQQHKFEATGFDILTLKCDKKVEIPIPGTSFKIPITKVGFELSIGLKGGVKVKREIECESKLSSYKNSTVYGGGYVKPKIYAELLGVKANIEIEAGLRAEYPYKGNFKQMAFVLYTSDMLGYVDIDKEVSKFITKNYRYELFNIPTNSNTPLIIDL